MFNYNYIMGMKAGRWRSRTNLTFVATNLHHPLLLLLIVMVNIIVLYFPSNNKV
jgi:hypothetical protein